MLIKLWESNVNVKIARSDNLSCSSTIGENVKIQCPVAPKTPVGNTKNYRYFKSTISFQNKVTTPSKEIQNRRIIKCLMEKLSHILINTSNGFELRLQLVKDIDESWAAQKEISFEK